jgi:uncharacterized membrane protein YidH (DUF202 family)
VSRQPEVPPAGWFDDPHGAKVLRYWDGNAWTDYLWPMFGEPTPRDALAAERGMLPWVRWAFVLYPVLLVGMAAVALFAVHDIVHSVQRSFESSSNSPRTLSPWTVGLQLGGVLAIGLQVVVALWTYRTVVSARSLGFQVRRNPGLAVIGWLVPVLNLWWPYQSIRDAGPERSTLQPVLGWWWAYYLALIPVNTAALVLAGVYSPGVAAPFLILVAGLAIAYAWTGRVLVARILGVHDHEFEVRRLGLSSDRPGVSDEQ